MTLKASLGCLPPPEYIPPPVHPDYGHHVPPVHRSPAYHRRQERRKAARVAAGHEGIQAKQVCNEVTEEIIEVNPVAEKATDNKEESLEKFECTICDFQSNWDNGLKVHMSRMHSRIEQLDGNADNNLEEDENYAGSKHYWMKGWLGGSYQSFIDANKVLEDSELFEDDMKTERAKLLDACKTALGENFMYFPPWDMS